MKSEVAISEFLKGKRLVALMEQSEGGDRHPGSDLYLPPKQSRAKLKQRPRTAKMQGQLNNGV